MNGEQKENRELYKDVFVGLGLSESERQESLDMVADSYALAMMMGDREVVVSLHPKRSPDSSTWEEIREEAEVLRALGEELLSSDE